LIAKAFPLRSELDKLHSAMGEFLTECSHLENMLIMMSMISPNGKTLPEIFQETLNQTFGKRIHEFKKAIAALSFSPEQQVIIDGVATDLDRLLPKRNLIVHGSTMEAGFADGAPTVYRIGAPKGDTDYMKQFLAERGNVEHAFSAKQIRQTADEARAIRGSLGQVVTQLMTALSRRPR
jgi:hypothetical protein